MTDPTKDTGLKTFGVVSDIQVYLEKLGFYFYLNGTGHIFSIFHLSLNIVILSYFMNF